MANPYLRNHLALNTTADEQVEIQRRFPCAAWWFGMAPTHPFIHGNQYRAPGTPIPNPTPPPPPYMPNHAEQPPPAYYPQALPPPPVMPVQASQTQITVQIPLNTGVVGGEVTLVPLRLPCDLSFADFFSRVCAKMDLEPKTASLGYRLSGDPARDIHRLANEEEYAAAIRRLVDKMRRARTRVYHMEIRNLRPAQQSVQALSASRARKRPDDEISQEEVDTTISFRPQLQELKRSLQCQLHRGKHCWVSPITLEHQQLNVFALTLWAKQMLLQPGVVTVTRPPATLHFDHRPVKRGCRQAPAPPQQPTIHVHNHFNGPVPLAERSQCNDTGQEDSGETVIKLEHAKSTFASLKGDDDKENTWSF